MRYDVLEDLAQIDPDSEKIKWFLGIDKSNGADVLIKRWSNLPIDNLTLNTLWSSHLRQTQKLSMYTDAEKYLMLPLNGWVAENGYNLAFRYTKKTPGVTSNFEKSDRKFIWSNLFRLAKAIEMIHNAGFIHRQIGVESVFSNPDSREPDFQLGNFDWSVWIRDPISRSNHVGHYSFLSDWRDFANLAIDLLGLDWDKASRNYARAGLTLTEYRALCKFKNVTQAGFSAISDPVGIVKNVSNFLSKFGTHYYLVVNTGNQSRNKVSIETDLVDPIVRSVKVQYTHLPQLVLVGKSNKYLLKPISAGSLVQTIDSIYNREFKGEDYKRIAPNQIRVFSHETDLPNNNLGARQWWSELVPGNRASNSRQLSALKQLLCCESIWQLAKCTWLVRLKTSKKTSSQNYTHTVEIVDDLDRNELNKLLGLKSPSVELEQTLIEAATSLEWHAQQWPLHDSEIDEWSFSRISNNQGKNDFEFIAQTQYRVGELFELRSPHARGNDPLSSRKLTFLNHLEGQQHLLKLLEDPRSQEPQNSSTCVSKNISELDKSKLEAISRFEAAPELFTIQGPPGVGKSFLLLHLVEKLFSERISPKLLIAAHGHATVNQFADKLEENRSELPHDVLIIRTKFGHKLSDVPFQIESESRAMLDNVLSSASFKAAPNFIRDEIKQISNSIGGKHALETLILSGADIVLTTTNSKEIEEYVDSRVVFDQIIIEEAGRASGTDLIGPLLLSGRRLLVGDPNQLPPFGEGQLSQFLKSERHFRKIINNEFLTRNRRSRSVLFSRLNVNNIENHDSIIDEIGNCANLFRNLFDKGSERATGLYTSAVLTEQYRMHPKIGDVVSELFYNKGLNSAAGLNISRAEEKMPFSLSGALTSTYSPLVFIDMPYVAKKSASGECAPPYWNKDELDAVVEVVKCISARSNTDNLDLAVLAPYNEQVRRLKQALKKNVKHLGDTPESLVHTIDSFQGNEADIVIVSLVRNNTHRYYKGLGILGDSRRVNVLMSRARWMLIIVGSSQFIRKRFPYGHTIEKSHNLYFLKQLSKKLLNRNVFKRIGSKKLAAKRRAIQK